MNMLRRRCHDSCGESDRGASGVQLAAILLVLGVLTLLVVLALHATDSGRGSSELQSGAPSKASLDSIRLSCLTDLRAMSASAEAVRVHEGMYPSASSDLV